MEMYSDIYICIYIYNHIVFWTKHQKLGIDDRWGDFFAKIPILPSSKHTQGMEIQGL